MLAPVLDQLNKPVVFTEAGTASTPYGLRESQPEYKGVVDLDCQLLYYKTLVKAFADEQWFFGTFWWDYGLTAPAGFEPTSGGVWDWMHTPRLKPAQEYLTSQYGGNGLGDGVRLDGVATEWTGTALLATDAQGDAPAGTPDITSLHAALDDRYLYLHVGFSAPVRASSLPYTLFFIDFNGDGQIDQRLAFGVSSGRHVATLQGPGADGTTYGYADAVLGQRDLEMRLPLAYVTASVSRVYVSFALHAVQGGTVVWLDRLGYPDGRLFGPVSPL